MASAERYFEPAEADRGRPAWMNFYDRAELEGLGPSSISKWVNMRGPNTACTRH